MEVNNEYFKIIHEMNDTELKSYCMNLINNTPHYVYVSNLKQGRKELLNEMKKIANID